MRDKTSAPRKPPTLAQHKRAAKQDTAGKRKRGRPRKQPPASATQPKPADDTLFTLRLSRRLAKEEAAAELAKQLPKRQGRPPGPYGPYKSRGAPKRGDALALAHRLAEDRAAGKVRGGEEALGSTTPPCPEQEAAHEWVAMGVRRLAMTCPPRNHVVLMAATNGETGKVGAASSIQLSAMGTMNALGQLVGQVNQSFVRDDVGIRVELRMYDADKAVDNAPVTVEGEL